MTYYPRPPPTSVPGPGARRDNKAPPPDARQHLLRERDFCLNSAQAQLRLLGHEAESELANLKANGHKEQLGMGPLAHALEQLRFLYQKISLLNHLLGLLDADAVDTSDATSPK